MEERTNSWVRRTSFSHTIYRRIDFSQLQAISFSEIGPRSNNPARTGSVISSLSMPVTRAESSKQNASYRQSISMPTSSNSNSEKDTNVNNRENAQTGSSTETGLRRNRRSLSPYNANIMSDAFKEAKAACQCQRFATPPRERGSKSNKDACWSKKYFDHGGSKVSALETSSEWSADMSKLYLGSKFASGSNSRLYRGIYDEKEVAVKIISQPDDDNDDDENGEKSRLEKQYIREVSCLSRLHHNNVIKLVAACKEPSIFFIMTEYASGGSLRTFLNKLSETPVPLPKVISIALNVARGMEYIHSQGVVHRDLKPENILTDEDQTSVKIADFGVSCEEGYCDPLEQDPGTYRWMAPEMIRRQTYGRKVDVYSFGLLLWEMVSGRIPYQDMTPIQAAFAVVDKNARPVVPEDCPNALRALMEKCWALRAEKRPEFWQIVKVLEQCETALAENGTLNTAKNVKCNNGNKWVKKMFQKLKAKAKSSSR